MATYKIDSSLLTAQADEIRTLNGTTATMNPSEMTTALQSANAEVAAQEQKIIEITEMLQGKAMGGSGEDVTAEVTAQTELIADLESAVNALPEAGSGGGSGGGSSGEPCTVEIIVEGANVYSNVMLYCSGDTWEITQNNDSPLQSVTLNTVTGKNIFTTWWALGGGGFALTTTGGVELDYHDGWYQVFSVNGSGTITAIAT